MRQRLELDAAVDHPGRLPMSAALPPASGVADDRPVRRLRWQVAAWVWLAVCAVVAVHQWQFWRDDHFGTDVMALLPHDEQAPEVGRAARQLADQVTRQVVVMIGAPDWAGARKAADAWQRAVDQAKAPLKQSALAGPDALSDTLAFYAPYRDRLLTPAQRAQLDHRPPAALAQAALGALARPGAGMRLSDWRADPLGLWPQWWSRARETRARPRDGLLALSDGGLEWVVLLRETTAPAFSLNGNAPITDALEAAEAAARAAVPGTRVVAGGVPLHAEVAAARANLEVNTIGWGSLAAVLLLVWLAFRSLRPMVLVGVSLAIGSAVALSVTAWVFGEVHLITIVFGASLVGVAEDYGIHYFASRQAAPAMPPLALMSRLLPGLVLALVTSMLGYVVLGLPPFPGLRQMALFSVTGLAATFATAACWFPWIDRRAPRRRRFARRGLGQLARTLPALRVATRRHLPIASLALFALACAIGLAALHTNDDLRQLQSSPPALVAAQREVGRLLGLASPAQFFVVRGTSAGRCCWMREESASQARLDTVVADTSIGRLSGGVGLGAVARAAGRRCRAHEARRGRGHRGGRPGTGRVAATSELSPARRPDLLEAWSASPASAPVRA